MKRIRTRFAPSPTGELHIGNARTALFTYLYAKKHNGTFILRLEDTDTQRSRPEFSDAIIDDIKWLGIMWDEGPFRQSERLQIYREYLNILIAKDLVYECFCRPEELEERRRLALKSGRPPVYDGRCRDLSQRERERLRSEGRAFTYRFKFSQFEPIEFDDIIRKKVIFHPQIMGDPILVRADGLPTYNFACTIDDMVMGITTIIRGEDLLDQTPRQIAILKSLGAEIPEYAHLPLIFGKSKKPLSKRDGATSVAEFREQGYLSIALLNYLYLLGYSPNTDRTLLSILEMEEMFEIERVSLSPAIFDIQKLRYINREAIRRSKPEQLLELFKSSLPNKDDMINEDFVRVFKEEIFTLAELRDQSTYIFSDGFEPDKFVDRLRSYKYYPNKELAVEVLNTFLNSLHNGKEFREEPLRRLIESRQIKPIVAFMIPRIALTGRESGPAIADIVKILGAAEIKKRITSVLNFL